MSLLSFVLSIQPRPPDVVGGGLTVVPNATAYTIGQTITVTVTGGPGAAGNAVGLYLLGDDPAVDPPVNDTWKYLENDSQTLPGVGAVNDVVTFLTTGLAPGSYVAHLLDVGPEDEPPPSTIFEVAGGPAGTFFGDLASATRDITHNFAADANYCVVLISYEESMTIVSVTIDPAGAAISMTQLGSPVVLSGSTAVVYYRHSLSLSGVKTIRVVSSIPQYLTIEATSWRNADNQAPAPTGTVALTGTSAAIPLSGVNPDGHLVMVANVNASPTINPSGGITINRQDNSPVDGWQGVTASQAPPISPSATPALSLSSSQRVAARAFVVNPTGGTPEPPPVSSDAPRIIVMTDIGEDPDDQQSMIRLLHYANEFRIVGLIATQDPALTGGPAGFTHTRPDLIRDHIEDYRLVLLNLQNHATGWPDPDDLLDLVRHGADVGTVAASVGPTKDTEGSELIIEAVDASNELTWICIWGGQVDLAQALDSAELRRGKSPAQFAAFLAKIRVYAIADQDAGLSAYIRTEWPTLWYIENGANGIGGQYNQQFRGMHQRDSEANIELVPTAQMALSTTAWVTTNIHGHGALGAAYPTNALINPQVGNNTGGGVKEGDTPAWFYLLHRGMQEPTQPTWGGWGGRLGLVSGSYWNDNNTGALDTIVWPAGADSSEANASDHAKRKWPIARWRVDYQNDFQARADWARTGTYASCSHHPIAAVDNDVTKTIIFRTAPAGSSVQLSAIGSTTDLGSTTGLTYNWMYYQEVTNGPAVTITNANSRDASFIAPTAGNVLHFILTVRNSGSPAPVLVSYRRVVITVTAAPAAAALPRLIITTDIGGDPNDRQEMIWFLTHVNEFRCRGLIASAAGTPGELTDEAPQPALINDFIGRYGSVRTNLTVHAPPASDWPTSSALLALVKTGSEPRFASNLLDTPSTDPGSANYRGNAWSHIIAMVDESPEPLWISIWGGAYDTAQAIRSASISKGPTSPAFATWKSKLRIHTITDQDGDTIAWIRTNHPDIWMINNGPLNPFLPDLADNNSANDRPAQFRGGYQNDHISGVPLVPSALFPMVHTPWVQANIHGHGALGDVTSFPTNVTQLPNTTNNHSIATGGGVKFADSAGWLMVLPNGLGNPDDPSWGSWGGRFRLAGAPNSPNYYEDALDTDHFAGSDSANAALHRKWPFARWREQHMNDIAARMDWCNTSVFTNANHYPVAVLNGDTTKNVVFIAVTGGATVNLSAAGSPGVEPDADAITYKWWHYNGVGNSYTGTISISGATSQACSFTTPNVNTKIYIILEIRDNGTPPLTSYRRAVVTVTAAGLPPAPLNATFWLRAEDAAAFTLVGSNISAAANQGSAGSAMDLTQGTAAARPLRVASVVNGKAVMRFDGGDWLRTAAIAGSAFLTPNQNVVFLVMKQTGTQVQNTSFSWRTAATTDQFVGHLSYNDVLYWYSGNPTASEGGISGAQPAGWDNAWHIVELVRDGATASIIVDGVTPPVATDATMTVGINLATSQTLTLGAQFNDTDLFLGDIAEIIIASGSAAVASAARQTVRQALATYYGISIPTAVQPLEAVNNAHLQVAINVQTAPRQTWLGYGWGAASINMTHWTAAAVTRLCEDMGATIVRYFTPETGATFLSAHQAHWNLVSAHGINKIFASLFVYRTANAPQEAAQDLGVPSNAPNITGARTGLNTVIGSINPLNGFYATLQNEPDGSQYNHPTVGGVGNATQTQIRGHYQTLKSGLNSSVKLLGLEYRHPQTLTAEFNEFNSAPSLYSAGTVEGQCFHVYDDGARNEYYDPIQTVGGNFFSTECGDNGFDVSVDNTVVNLTSPYTAARFIAAINAGAEVEIHHAAVGTVDNDGKVQSLIHSGTGLPRGGWYAACKIISKNMIPGTVMRQCWSTDTPPAPPTGPAMSAIQASRMIIDSATCECQPRQLVAYGVRPDGRRVLVAVNHAYDSVSATPFAGGHYGAPSSPGPNQQLTVTDPAILTVDRAWSGHRATRAGVESATTVNMHDGVMRFTLAPGETIAITQDP